MNPSQNSWLSNNIKSILAVIIVIGSLGYLFMVTFAFNDTSIRSQALVAMVTLISGVSGYYYGYSQGASKKDEAAANQLANSQVSSTTTTTAPVTSPSGAGEGG